MGPPRGVVPAMAAACLAAQPAADAAGPGLLDNAFFASFGAYKANSDVTVELDGETGTGTPVDLDTTFGANDANRLRFDGFWRFADRHKVRALWFQAKVKRTRTLDREIDWGDEVYPVGADVTLDRKFDIYEIAYEYAFLKRDKLELAGSLGLHYARFSADLSAELDADGQPGGETRRASESAGLKAPLPVIGLHGTWNPGGRFWIDGGAQLFSLSFDQVDGSLVDYRLAAIWQPRKWLGIGVGYDYCTVDVNVDGSSFDGKLDWTYDGPQLFLSAAF